MEEAIILGMKLIILVQVGTKTFYPQMTFHIGDDPTHHDVASIKCERYVQHSCIKCMYDLSTGGACDFDEEKNRKLNHELLNNVQIPQTRYLKVLKGELREKNENNCLLPCRKKDIILFTTFILMLIFDLMILYIISCRIY